MLYGVGKSNLFFMLHRSWQFWFVFFERPVWIRWCRKNSKEKSKASNLLSKQQPMKKNMSLPSLFNICLLLPLQGGAAVQWSETKEETGEAEPRLEMCNWWEHQRCLWRYCPFLSFYFSLHPDSLNFLIAMCIKEY